MNGGKAMVRSGHVDNLRDFAHPGLPGRAVKPSSRHGLPRSRAQGCIKACHPWLLDSGTPCRNDEFLLLTLMALGYAASARIRPTPVPANALPHTVGRSCFFQAALTASPCVSLRLSLSLPVLLSDNKF
jgi:hypothetical protein